MHKQHYKIIHVKIQGKKKCGSRVRTISYRDLLLIVIIVIVSLCLAQEDDTVYADWRYIDLDNEISASGSTRDRNTNLHFTGKYCEECHTRTPEKGQEKHLKFNGDLKKLCSCHDYGPGKYTHPVGIIPSEEKKARMPGDFPTENGILTCNTCHEIQLQCERVQFVSVNRKFLRGGPYKTRTGICFSCHDESKYKKLDPHTQLNAAGEIIEEVCLYCHAEKPDEKIATFENITLIGDIKMVCERCHNALEKHPSGRDHLKKPNEKMLDRMKISEILYSTIFPLDHEERITCITCHNPHERGVIPKESEGATGSSEKFKQRLTNVICGACHEEYS